MKMLGKMTLHVGLSGIISGGFFFCLFATVAVAEEQGKKTKESEIVCETKTEQQWRICPARDRA